MKLQNENKAINRPGVAGPVLKTPLLLIHSVSQWSFSLQSSKHHNSQTVRARDLKFWDNVHHPLCVTCHMSRVIFHVSPVTRHVPHVMCHQFFSSSLFLDKVVELVAGGSVINGATPSSLLRLNPEPISTLVELNLMKLGFVIN